MLVDEYDQYPNEKTTDVVVSSPGSDEPTPPSAADRMFLSRSPSPSSIGGPPSKHSLDSRSVKSDWDATGDLSAGRSSPIQADPMSLVPICDLEIVADPSSRGSLDEAMMARVLPKNPDLETEDETYNTWHIQDWRKQDRKIHGPIFKCGGFPWWVIYLDTTLFFFFAATPALSLG